MTALHKCPFCGGEAKVIGFDAPERWVVCQSCKASGQSFSLEATATAAWNRRAPSAAYAAGAEAMRERAAAMVEDAIYTSGGEQPFIRSRAASASQRQIRDLHHDTLAAAIRALPLPEETTDADV